MMYGLSLLGLEKIPNEIIYGRFIDSLTDLLQSCHYCSAVCCSLFIGLCVFTITNLRLVETALIDLHNFFV